MCGSTSLLCSSSPKWPKLPENSFHCALLLGRVSLNYVKETDRITYQWQTYRLIVFPAPRLHSGESSIVSSRLPAEAGCISGSGPHCLHHLRRVPCLCCGDTPHWWIRCFLEQQSSKRSHSQFTAFLFQLPSVWFTVESPSKKILSKKILYSLY